MSHPRKKVPGRPVILIILDGFGVNPAKANNAVVLADTPNLERCRRPVWRSGSRTGRWATPRSGTCASARAVLSSRIWF
jgi:2,3-bisphosphoglycerate-independent phosphoglycerate mutase